MFTRRGDALGRLFAERREWHAALMRQQDAIALALRLQVRGEGPGPTDAEIGRLGRATAGAERADNAYLRMLSE
ncbi:MAG: hypothetical protein EOO22_20615, partial [Comamonadaceae bacterium]